jgi:acyl-CoA thioester hydrolase
MVLTVSMFRLVSIPPVIEVGLQRCVTLRFRCASGFTLDATRARPQQSARQPALSAETAQLMAELIETYRGAVYPWHCDHVGHMNVMFYVGKFDEATWNFFAALGLTPSYLRENKRGMAAVEQRIAYQRELHAGDIVVVRSGMLEVRDKVIRFVHEMRNAETQDVSAITMLTGVHMDTVARKSCGLPAEIVAAARSRVVDYKLPW